MGNEKPKFENFIIEQISRMNINFADYNPRKITPSAKKKLKAKIKKTGFVMPVVINKRTGNIVAGHQRIAILDELHKKKEYTFTAALIDVDEKEEVELNIFLNNQSAMGEWDAGKLGDIKELFPDIDFVNDLGFDFSDIEFFQFNDGIDLNVNMNIDQEVTKKGLDEINNARKKHREKVAKNDQNKDGKEWVSENDYMVTFVFNNNKDKHEFMEKINKPRTEKYLKYTVLYDLASNKYELFL